MLSRLVLLVLLSLGALQANNTETKVRLQVTLYTGEELQGTVKFKPNYLEIRAPGKKKIKYPSIESLAEIPAPDEAAMERRRVTYARKAERAGDDPKALLRVGVWARGKGLEEEALATFTKAITIDPEFTDAYHRMGKIQHEGEWADSETVIATERRALKSVTNAELIKLVRKAEKHGAPNMARHLLSEALAADPWDKTAIKLIRKYTERYRQTTQPWQFPLRGRWRASPDSTRHHQHKGYALYALDLMKTDAAGKLYKTDGKTNADYHCFGAPVYAVAKGTVIQVREGWPDNEIGKIPEDPLRKHNGISLMHEDGEMSWYIHTKMGSITVKEGDTVEAGQLLGEVGNSGNSGRPHLHFTLARWAQTSLPWHCDDYAIIAPDGTRLRITRAFPREGWWIEHTPKESSDDDSEEESK